jgi:predicted AAA+ superfamily ATPase
MRQRLITFARDYSFFVFGPRACGKTTWIKYCFPEAFLINLLDPIEEEKFASRPNELVAVCKASKASHILIDEIQKVPKLLDIVHHLIETTDKLFILTGSSARKLKYGGANLLAGRAFVYHLHPFSALELPSDKALQDLLQWGMLPKINSFKSEQSKSEYLQAYAHTYLKEEIWAEQFVKDLAPFRKFLEVAAQGNGKIVNFSNIAKDVGVTDETIKRYYSILEDTMIGFFLEPFKSSFRKRLSQKPKFYFFDTGVTRALSKTLSVNLVESTYAFGNTFEHHIILECFKLASYYKREFGFSYIQTQAGQEIDLVIERPGQSLLLIEVKSSIQVNPESLKSFIELSADIPEAEAICLSRDIYPKQIEHVRVLPWQDGLKEIFELNFH